MIVALVEDVGRAGFEFRLTADLDVVDGRIRHLDATRDIVPRMIDDVHLHAADAPVPFGPFTHLAHRDRARVDQPAPPAWRTSPRKRRPDAAHSHPRASSERPCTRPNDNADGNLR